MPHLMPAPLERDAHPEEYRKVVSHVPRTAVIEIEEHRLSVRPTFQDDRLFKELANRS